MAEAARSGFRAPQAWVVWGGAATLLGALAALAYAIVEIRVTGGLADAPLIVLVTLNGLIVYRLGASIAKDLGVLFSYMPEAGKDPQRSVDLLLGNRALVFVGLCFGAFMAIAVWNIDPWTGAEQPVVMRAWLCIFLFASNLIIGAVLLAIVHFWHILLNELERIEISVINLSSPVLCALLTVNSRLVMGTAVVCSLAVCSVPLSSYTMNPVTKFFSGFALLVVIATYAVPMLPLSNVLSARKAAALDRLERLIEAHVAQRSGLAPPPGTPETLPPLGELIEARDIVDKVRTLPPGGQFSVSAAAIVAFLSFLPTLIDYAISKLP